MTTNVMSRVGEYLGYCIGDTQISAFFRNCIVTEIHFQNRECIVTWGYSLCLDNRASVLNLKN